MHPLVIDSFAGGGGASEGIEEALRILKALGFLDLDAHEHVDFAINHDDAALAMHAANHPRTVHLPHNVWKVSLRDLVGRRTVDLLWLSPDCRHHSRAKGGAPVSKSVRDLAWVALRWLKELRPDQRPRRVFLENVREFKDWGPLIPDGKGGERPDPARRGETFAKWVAELKRAGYRRIEWRELRACDYGIPTTRLRLYMIASRDPDPIVWPEPTHGDPKSEGVRAGRLKPWPVAADIIDWDRPCPSIFLTREEARAYTKATGIRIIRPLAPNTDARIAKGVKRYVLDAAKPFIVTCNHAGPGFRGQDLAEPFATVTGARDAHGLVAPILITNTTGHPGAPAGAPLATVTTGGHHIAVAPHLVAVNHGDSGGRREYGADEPVGTVTPARSRAIVAPYLVPRYGERPGQDPRTRSLEEPAPTVVPTGNGGDLAAVYLAQHNGRDVGRGADEPASTVAGSGGHQAVVAATFLKREFGQSIGSAAEAPVGTVTPGGQGKTGVVAAFLAQHNENRIGLPADAPVATVTTRGTQTHVVSAFMAQHNNDTRRDGGVNPGRSAEDPLSTVTGTGSHQSVIAASMLSLKGSARRAGSAEEPHPAVCAGGQQSAVVTLPMLSAYYRTGEGQSVDTPTRTATTNDRFGLVEVTGAEPPLTPEQLARARQVADFLRRHGCWDAREFVTVGPWIVVDIGMRMLTARELARANGLPERYDLAVPYQGGTLSDTEQRHKIGNCVCPGMATTLVVPNHPARAKARRSVRPAAPAPLFAAE